MALFSVLADCLGAEEKLHFELRREGAVLTVLVLPQLKPSAAASDPALQAAREALHQPLVVRGTPAALDQELPAALAQYGRQRAALRTEADGLAALEAAVRQARQAIQTKRAPRDQAESAPVDAASQAEAATPPPAVDLTVNPDSLF